MAASASSYSLVRREKYDVFISFRGSDIRLGFLSHLTKGLRQNHIDVYVDERLERGEEISTALMEAIEGSMISLVIFSKDYASSKWCLEELIKIMKCKETSQQIVIPVFYNIDPSHVKHQIGSYADAFAKHEERFKDNTEKLQIWRSALTKTTNLSGYHYSLDFQNESEVIDGIVDDIMEKWEDKYPKKSRGSKLLVGIYHNFAKVRSLMELEPQEVRFLGIWGTGGIGKTTLAQEIFERFSSQFQSSCFLENVRAKSKKMDGFKHLRQELLSQLLNQKSLHVDAAIGRLKRKKVLIVLDDVDNPRQLRDLAVVEETFLGWGSTVIITSRDKHVFRSVGIDEEYIHEVKELNFEESLKLFNLNAFKQNHPRIGYEGLSKRTVAYAKGIPLALEVLGRHFSSRSNTYWESELRKLQKYPKQDIQNILKGTEKIEVIKVDVAQIKDVRLGTDTFKEMRKLRIIKFYSNYGCRKESHIKLPLDLDCFPSNLRYFHWDLYPLESLPSGFCPENLVGLHMEFSNMKKLWDGVQDLPNLEILNLSGSQQLMELPNFSMARKLQTVYLLFCENLRSVHPSILSQTLVDLDVSCCPRLESLESEVRLKSLFDLKADGCVRLKKFCLSIEKVERLDLLSSRIMILHLPISGKFPELKELFLDGSRLSSLPINELRRFTNLERFQLDNFHQVIHRTGLEILFSAWGCLRCLCLDNCIQLSEIPDNISALTELEYLSLEGSGVEIFPACLQHLSNLRKIRFRNSKMLISILGPSPTLDRVVATDCTSVETIIFSSQFQDQFLDHGCLLDFKNCTKLDEPSLDFIEKLIQCSIIAATKKGDAYNACYSGSRVPNWMRYKQMTSSEASNTIEFTCNDEQPLVVGMVFCCVLPSTPVEMAICCNYYVDSNLKFKCKYTNGDYQYREGYYSDHVFIRCHKFRQVMPEQVIMGGLLHMNSLLQFGMVLKSPSKHVECALYMPQREFVLDGKRKRDAHVDDIVSLRKGKHHREI